MSEEKPGPSREPTEGENEGGDGKKERGSSAAPETEKPARRDAETEPMDPAYGIEDEKEEEKRFKGVEASERSLKGGESSESAAPDRKNRRRTRKSMRPRSFEAFPSAQYFPEERKYTRFTQAEVVPLSEHDDVEFLPYSQWHLRMQTQHRLHRNEYSPGISRWKWCLFFINPFKKLESTDYNAKMCNVLCTYSSFKSFVTKIIFGLALYLILLEIFGEKMYPGEKYFFLAAMFLASFLMGKFFFAVGLPTVVGQLLVGIAFGNLPTNSVPSYTDEDITLMIGFSEKFYLMLMLIRAALLLDFSKIQNYVFYTLKFAVIPLVSEFTVVVIFGYLFLDLPWQWSALQGSILSPVSLASVVSVMEKSNKYGICGIELSTILIAASSIEIILSLYTYSICVSIIFSKGLIWGPTVGALILAVVVQFVVGILLGCFLGCLIGIFPDRRSSLAPCFRIALIGMFTIVLLLSFHFLGMTGLGVLSCLTMTFIACNIWIEFGWHEENNPVRYFYTMLYGYVQPIVVSLIGFTVRFDEIDPLDCACSAGVILLGLSARELAVFLLTFDKTLPTSMKEKIFICLCWSAKGSAEALLAAVLGELVVAYYEYLSDDSYTLDQLLIYAKKISYTSIIGIIITAPITSLLTTFLAPRFRQN